MGSLFDGIFQREAPASNGGLFSAKSSFFAAAGTSEHLRIEKAKDKTVVKEKSAQAKASDLQAAHGAPVVEKQKAKKRKADGVQDPGTSVGQETSSHALSKPAAARMAAMPAHATAPALPAARKVVPEGAQGKKKSQAIEKPAPEPKATPASMEAPTVHESLTAGEGKRPGKKAKADKAGQKTNQSVSKKCKKGENVTAKAEEGDFKASAPAEDEVGEELEADVSGGKEGEEATKKVRIVWDCIVINLVPKSISCLLYTFLLCVSIRH